jgi:ketosteroid isomerase-like protein
MSRPKHLMFGLLVLVSACAHTPAADRGGLQQRQESFLGALAAKELDSAVGHFAPDAVIHIANLPPVQGREAIGRLYGNIFRFLRASEYTPEVMRISRSGDLAYSSGGVTTVFDGERGPVEYPGKYLLVWEKRAGAWIVVAYSISNNRAETGQ